MSHLPDHDPHDEREASGTSRGGASPDDLDRMRTELAALGAPAMPADVAARIGAAVAEELRGPQRSTGAVSRPRAGRSRARVRAGRARRSAVLAGLVAAAVVTVVAVTVGVGAPSGPRVANEETDLRAAGGDAVGEQGSGALADPRRRQACLQAAGVPGTTAPLLGGRPYPVRGEAGTLLVLGTEVRGRFRLVVVDAACGAGAGRLLASTTAGR